MVDSSDDYAVEIISGIPEIRRHDGELIPQDNSKQIFCDFLTWVSHQTNAPTVFSQLVKGQYFAERSKFIEACKVQGVLLLPNTGVTPLGPLFYSADPDNLNFSTVGQVVAGSLPDNPNSKMKYRELWLSTALRDSLRLEFADDNSDIRKLTAVSVVKSFVYLDVSDFSTYSPIEQALIVNSINQLSSQAPRRAMVNVAEAFDNIEARLCIGDGYIYCFADPMLATFFAGILASRIEIAIARGDISIEFHFRMGVHTGPVYYFWDPGRNDWNYIGEGINGGSRVLEAIGKGADDLVFVSSAVRSQILASRESVIPYSAIRKSLTNRGRRDDKHGNKWRVYEFNHTQFAELLHLF